MTVLIFTSENKELEEEVARKTAGNLDYQVLGPEFLGDVASMHSLDQSKLELAMSETPSILRRMPSKLWHYYLSCVEMEVLKRLLDDNIVCWGLRAHLFVLVVSHVLKVKLVNSFGADKKMESEKQRQADKWSQAAYNRNDADPGLYDLVINMDQITPEEVVSTVSSTVSYPRFNAMTYSTNNLKDWALAAKVKNRLLKSLTDVQVHAQNGTIVVTTTSLKREKTKKITAIKEIAEGISDIGYLEVHWNKDLMREAAQSYR